MNQTVKHITRWVLYPLIALLLIGLAGYGALQTDYVLGKIKQIVENQASSALGAELSIESLSGTWPLDPSLEGIVLIDNGDTLANIDRLSISVPFWENITSPIQISRVDILNPNVYPEFKDGEWNLTRLLGEGDESPDSDSTKTTGYPNISLANLSITDGLIELDHDSEPLLNQLRADSIQVDVGGRLHHKKGWRVDLTSFSTRIGRSDEQMESSVRIALEARADRQRIALDRLLLRLGTNRLSTGGFVSLDQQNIDSVLVQAAATLNEREAIQSWADTYPVVNDGNLTLSLMGAGDNWGTQLNGSMSGLDSLSIDVQGTSYTEPVIQSVAVSLTNLNTHALVDSLPDISVAQFGLDVNGSMPILNYTQSDAELELTLSDVRYDTLYMRSGRIAGNMANEDVSGRVTLETDEEEVDIAGEVADLFGKTPVWSMKGDVAVNRLEKWVPDQKGSGDLNINASGRGLETYPAEPHRFDLRLSDFVFADRQWPVVELSGDWGSENGSLNLYTSDGDSSLTLNGEFSTRPLFKNVDLRGELSRINLRDYLNRENTDTDLNVSLHARGDLSNLRQPQLVVDLSGKPSVINGAQIDSLGGKITIDNEILVLEEMSIASTLLDLTGEGLFRYTDLNNPQNNLAYRIELKELGRLAPLLGVEHLNAEGAVEGRLSQSENAELIYTAELDLENLQYDSLFAGASTGAIEARWADSVFYTSSLEISEPQIGSTILKDFSIKSEGAYKDLAAVGSMGLKVNLKEQTGSNIKADFDVTRNQQDFMVTAFSFTSPRRTFTLQDSTAIRIQNNGAGFNLSMDTLDIRAPGDAFLKLFARAGRDTVIVESNFAKLDIGAAYGSVFGDIPLESQFNGYVIVRKEGDYHSTDSYLNVTDLKYNDIEIDTTLLQLSIYDDWLKSALQVKDDGDTLVSGSTSIPFRLGDPSTFEDAFFEQEISGELLVDKLPLNQFKGLIDTNQVKLRDGLLSSKLTLSGTANSPYAVAEASIHELLLGRVKVDSIGTQFDYQHDKKQIAISGAMEMLENRVIEVEGVCPFLLDLKEFNRVIPKDNEPLRIDARTNDLKLAVLNGVVDKRVIRNIQGTLNSTISINGAIGEPKFESSVTLTDGGVELVSQGIRLRDIGLNVGLNNNEITVDKLAMKSNTGQTSLKGRASIDGLNVREVDLSLTMKRFQLIDTRDIALRSTADISLQGDLMNLTANGDITVDEGNIYLDNFGSKKVESVALEGEVKNSTPFIDAVEVYENLKANIGISLPRNLWIRNREYPELMVELQGELDLIKERKEEAEMFGQIDSRKGYAAPFSKRFELEEGTFTFSGDPANPQLNIRSLYTLRRPDNIKIWYIISGTVQEPTFSFESDPKMENKDIISYTLFGKPFASLMGWQQGVTDNNSSGGGGNTVSNAALNVLINQFETYATDNFGVDVIEIENDASASSGSGTSIKAGKYMSERIFVALVQQVGGSGPLSQVLVEYLLTENLELILTQSTDEKTGIDVEWKYEY